ncbi:uncharacterized protein LOC114366107 [Ostrinia furnacalis]|uniref:uncharacterized protein LOC114366107 n=1 Tax=Ostrinia furnacalis TaxID=93504 RepID=UPI00103E4BD3|nr:uncharacterized protein LOC114366107 [Ostrinia furnacalis]
MIRATVMISMLALWCGVAMVQGSPVPKPAPEPAPEPAPAPGPKDLSYLALDDDEEMPIIEDYRTKNYGELRTVLSTIKEQFREIIEDLLVQVVNYFEDILRQIKLKLLKKLSLYKMSDVVRVVFDGVTDFMLEPVPDYYDEPVRKPAPVSSYTPFSLASLLGSRK